MTMKKKNEPADLAPVLNGSNSEPKTKLKKRQKNIKEIKPENRKTDNNSKLTKKE